MINNDEKYNYSLNMHYDVHYCPAKIKIKIQLVYKEIKITYCIMGVNGLNSIV